MQCSFCQKSEKTVGRLISSPSDYPRAFICDECVLICASILEDDKAEAEAPEAALDDGRPWHPLLAHPRASELMEAVEYWIREESLGNDAAAALAEVRRIASSMMG
jgi:ATP-dependent protease Clp ATPase subunit